MTVLTARSTASSPAGVNSAVIPPTKDEPVTRRREILLAAALCTASLAGPASATGSSLDRPTAGAAITPNVAADQSLGMAILGARVGRDGSLAIAAGATSAIRRQAGVYTVRFDRNVSGCIYSTSNNDTTDRSFSVGPSTSDVNSVYINVSTSSGFVDGSFYLTVFCNR